MMKIGYLGPKGSFTYSAVTSYFKNGEWISYDSLIDLIDAQLIQELTYAMVPIENSIEGSVLPTLDHVYETLPSIQGEIILPIRQQWFTKSDKKSGDRQKKSVVIPRRWHSHSFF